MTAVKHTPTPWKSIPMLRGGYGRSQDEVTADEAFIVKAVNCHDELVEALQDTLNMLKAAHLDLGMQHDSNRRVVKARAALTRVKGGAA